MLRIIPQTLKNKFVLAFFVFIIFPFCILTFYYFQEVEEIMQEQISQQNREELKRLSRELEDTMVLTLNTAVLLEQDSTIEQILRSPERFPILERHYHLDEKFNSINNSLFLTRPKVYFTIIDFYNNVYSSFQSRQGLEYKKVVTEDWYIDFLYNGRQYHWEINEKNYIHSNETTSPYSVLAHFLLEDEQNLETIKNSFNYYEKITTHDSSLSYCVHSIMASKLGYDEKAYNYFIETARLDLDNTHGNTKDGLHMANMGGTWLAIVFGFAGFRLKEDGIYLNPSLPNQWEELTFNIQYKGSLIHFNITKDSVHYELLEGDALLNPIVSGEKNDC